MLVAPAGSEAEFPLWPPLLASRGPGGRSAKHAHHALHVVLAVEGELRVRGLADWRSAAGVVTAADAAHEIDAIGVEVLLVFLDPESAAGARLVGVVQQLEPGEGAEGRVRRGKQRAEAFRLIAARERDGLVDLAPGRLMREDGVEWVQRVANVLGAAPLSAAGENRGEGPSGAATPRVHPRVRRALRHLRTLSPSEDQSLAALSKVAGLSEGRFMHAFTESVGIPLRPYLAWLKLQRAAAAIVTGSTLSEAAYGAGFADAAHMTRAFRRMFGVRPSELRKT
jgi:AraC-like DNA-binding protein